ncbi:MAG: DUF3426 domain-containing protein [Luteimonas sp.]
MDLNCPHCHALVAADPVTGVAPEHCPYCDGLIVVAAADQAEIDADADAGEAAEHATKAVPDDAAVDVTIDAKNIQTDAPSDPPIADQPRATEPAGGTGGTGAAAAPARKKNVHPSFMRRRAVAHSVEHARWPWMLAGSLLLLLAVQLVIADRGSLAADARWRGAMIRVCHTLRCDIPAWREAGAFTMLHRDVRAHSAAANALRVQAAFRNDARWPQAWPELVLTLSDATGRVTGSRSFTAVEYLGHAPTQKLIATGQTANFVLDVVEPAPNTVSFSFDFR